MKQLLQLQVAAALDELHEIESALESLGEQADWDVGLIYQVQLVLEELAVNTVNYGFENDGGKTAGIIEIVISEDDDSIRIEYSDNGKPFNPFEDAPEPDLDSDLAERRVGGLGVHLVRTMMDEASYRRGESRNHVRLVKKRVAE
ncbi:MAG: ATP-binding protein [Gammaproteobacteria bacterium]|nr:ATP-binding protein [Gammaproteobacteria bacterium]MCY4200987.1 ATP-binding protein [Gammaproteobacteria bacterium]MCY4277318.1 ATP-binding protein [Gammaproteobacteria bacterium]MCY4323902.1 ATP-binding protein [Gammaproteobacteria bacterium]